MMNANQEVTKATIEFEGVPCTVSRTSGKRGRAGAKATLHAVRGLHSPRQVLDAYKAASSVAKSVDTVWTDHAPDRENVGKDYRSGVIHGFQWRADWSTGCRVYLLIGTEYRHREDVRIAMADLRKFFEERLRTLPDCVEAISHADQRAWDPE
jgi:hypothetical protein